MSNSWLGLENKSYIQDCPYVLFELYIVVDVIHLLRYNKSNGTKDIKSRTWYTVARGY